MTRYLPRDEIPCDVYGAPDFAQRGWEYAALADLAPSPVGLVAVATTREEGREQASVMLFQDRETPTPASMRVRAHHHVTHWENGSDEPGLTREEAVLDGVEYLQLSAYGPWGEHSLIAALREAADMLEEAGTARGEREL